MLHFAPEPWFEKRLRARLGPAYRTADLNNPRVDVRMDICDIQYPDQTFDVVYCSHVLEHVQDDAKAMAEMRRVVKRSGWVVLMVPIIAPATHEDPRVTDPQERLRLYGQNDHVRAYGPDFVDRVRAAGFEVGVFRRQDLAAPDEIARMGLSRSGEVFYCRPSGDPPLRQPSSPEPRPKG